MEENEIEKQLMKKLGILKDEAKILIKSYVRIHKGKIELDKILDDIQTLADSMIYGVGDLEKSIDVYNEINEKEFNRKNKIIMDLLMDDDERRLANSYLNNVEDGKENLLIAAFCNVAKKLIRDILNSGIGIYRDFVMTLPYENIGRVARAFGMEKEIASFLVQNGTEKDLQIFMNNPGKILVNGIIYFEEYDIQNILRKYVKIEANYGYAK